MYNISDQSLTKRRKLEFVVVVVVVLMLAFKAHHNMATFQVKLDLWCPSMHLFRHQSRNTDFLTLKSPKSLAGFKPTAVRGMWFEVKTFYL
jgi:hypothetical protein